MAKKRKVSPAQTARSRPRAQPRRTGQPARPVARWEQDGPRRLLVLENAFCRVAFWPARGGALVSYVDRATELDVIWRNPQVDPRDSQLLDQPVGGGSDLYDVMDGSWYVSLPNGFFAGDYCGAPLGTHGGLRAVAWKVTRIVTRPE